MEIKLSAQKMVVEVWSDIMCPFCYIGKRKFEFALNEFPEKDQIEISWKSFQLDPSIPDNVSDSVYEYLAKMKGMSLEQSISMHQNVAETAKKIGLEYNFDKTKVANSFKAHVLIQFAKTKGFGNEIEEELFKAYFTDGKNVSNEDALIEIGKNIGLIESEIKNAFSSPEFIQKMKNDLDEAQQIGVKGVPFFVFNRKYAVSGAQSVDIFLNALKQSFVEWENVNNSKTCSPNSGCC